MNRSNFDLKIYLVTDSGMIPEGLTFMDQVKAAIENGVTCIQLREKHLDTRDFVDRATQVHELTKKAGIPLIINDRLDVALAVDAEGLHVGQDDMTVPMARKLFGPDKIIGVSTSTPEHVIQAVKDEADYIGIGIIFDTATKITNKLAMGPGGAYEMLKVVKAHAHRKALKTCVIGGINQSNIHRVKYGSASSGIELDGAAVVSCIMAAKDAAKATRDLVEQWEMKSPFWEYDVNSIAISKPLVHHITNDVVKNFSANVTLAAGGSPIMSECSEEFEDFAKIPGCSLVLNTGTPTESQVKMYISAIKAYNKYYNHIVYDPVGAGASSLRKNTARKLLVEGYMTVIKGNTSEIRTLAGYEGTMKGVDNTAGDDEAEAIEAARTLSQKTKSIVVITGKVDYIVHCDPLYYKDSANEEKIEIVKGGHPLMGEITGSGCSLGSVIATSLSRSGQVDRFGAVVRAVKYYKAAGALAGGKTNGPGSFQVEFLNALKSLSMDDYLSLG